LGEPAVLLLIAVSARALAQAARRAGFAAIAIDAFGDVDAQAGCREMQVVGNAMGGFAGVDLTPHVARLSATHAPAGIVFGSGFDDGPEALEPLARFAPLIGRAKALARCKDPQLFARDCAATGLAHPEIGLEPAPGFLIKRRGGSGGLHIAAADRPLRAQEYVQRRIEGRAVSLLFVRDAHALTPIAWSEQWTAPAPDALFRYGGAAGPIEVEAPGLIEKLAALTARLGVRGLASADFLDDGKTFWLLEINPRPGATLDVFDDDGDPLLAHHIAAMGEAPAAPPKPRKVRAAEIVYAEADTIAPADWPEATADRPAAGTEIPAGAPICTVFAPTRREAHEQSRMLQARLKKVSR